MTALQASFYFIFVWFSLLVKSQKLLVYDSSVEKIFIMNGDGSNKQVLIADPGMISSNIVSFESRIVASRQNGSEIVVWNTDGSPQISAIDCLNQSKLFEPFQESILVAGTKASKQLLKRLYFDDNSSFVFCDDQNVDPTTPHNQTINFIVSADDYFITVETQGSLKGNAVWIFKSFADDEWTILRTFYNTQIHAVRLHDDKLYIGVYDQSKARIDVWSVSSDRKNITFRDTMMSGLTDISDLTIIGTHAIFGTDTILKRVPFDWSKSTTKYQTQERISVFGQIDSICTTTRSSGGSLQNSNGLLLLLFVIVWMFIS